MSLGRFTDIRLFYAHAGFFAFAEIIFLLSLPILLFQQGFSLSFIFLFHAVISLVGYFLTPLVLQYFIGRNLKTAMCTGVFLYVCFGFLAPLITPDNFWWILVLGILALQSVCYWPARHFFFAELVSDGKVGLQTGILSAVALIARIIAPFLAGALALITNFNLVFLLGAVILLASFLPILFITRQIHADFNIQEFRKMQKSHALFLATKLPYRVDGLNNAVSYILWPLFFYLLLSNQSYFDLGSLMTVTSAISAGIMILVGHFFDRAHRKFLLTISVFSQMVASLGRFILLFFHPALFIYAVQSLYSFAESALASTFNAYWYAYGRATNTAFFTLHREINFSLGRFLFCLFFAIVSYFFPDPQDLWIFFLLNIPLLLFYLNKIKGDHFLKNEVSAS